MRKHRLFSIAVLAAFLTASIVITACGGLNNPKSNGSNSTGGDTTAPQILETNVFPKAPEGTTYSGYIIRWTDAKGHAQERKVTMDDIKNGIVLTGGVKEGTKPKVTPLVKNADGTETEKPDATQEVNPSSSTNWKSYIQAGIAELEKEHPDFDAALAKFKDAYNAEQNNTTKAYYAVVQLAYISVKPETVNFMQNRMGFAAYPGTLNALVNLEWFDERIEQYPNPDGTTSERIFHFPKMKAAAEWCKEFDPLLQIPAYLIEHSDSANIDQLLDELYGILFGKEFTDASNLLNSLDASKPVIIDKKLIEVLHMDKDIFDAGTDVELYKDQLLGIIGGLTVTKGAIELLQSYSFNTDLNILKWNWEKEDEILKNLGSYNVEQDPFNNGFLKGRNQQKIVDAKNNIVKGADLLLAAYKSLTDSETLPSEVRAKVKETTDFIQRIVQEIRDAIKDGRKADILIGENNPLAKPPVPQPGNPPPVYLTEFKIDMEKVFEYEYFKLTKLFEMNGSKPKIYPADGFPYMKLTLKSFLDDFVTIRLNDGREVFEDFKIPLNNAAGAKIINFYKD
jgi:putative lipoprotein